MLRLYMGARALRFVAMALLILFSAVASSWAAASEEQICDVSADGALGLEDYPAAIALHRQFLRLHRDMGSRIIIWGLHTV